MSAPDKELRDWLEIASDKLAPPARERIALEIEAHYAEALAAHTGDGSDEAATKAAALKELGDAKVAAKRFRKQHLTEKEAEIIEKMLKAARNPWWILVCGVCLMLCICNDRFSNSPRHDGPLSIGLLIESLVCAVGYWLVGKFSNATYIVRRLLLIEAVLYCTLPIWLISRGEPLLIIGILPIFIKNFPRFVLLSKLRRIKDVWQEMPPSGTVAS